MAQLGGVYKGVAQLGGVYKGVAQLGGVYKGVAQLGGVYRSLTSDRLLRRDKSGCAKGDHGESPPQNRRTKRKSSFSSIMTNRRAISFRLSVPTNQNEEV